ncbi:hypothetical protein FA13DRAFT_1741234 [Coprinellus micaceus]|uniref:DUF6533 domain-containing protein n=1 Tax=Coprinellus micaceus TaxID=71717 RepID=A0A4Y7SK86_COPMI|nr:hypothetical protein FA13DRAFT_1741234 [Coprinellus micaceus]
MGGEAVKVSGACFQPSRSPIRNIAVEFIRRRVRGLGLTFLVLLPSADPAPAVLLSNSPAAMLDMQEWSQRLQTERHRVEYERLNMSVQLASITLLYYDYMLTFLDEVEYIWSQPRKLTTLFYVFCRYALIANPLYLLSVATKFLEVRDTFFQVSPLIAHSPTSLQYGVPPIGSSQYLWAYWNHCGLGSPHVSDIR